MSANATTTLTARIKGDDTEYRAMLDRVEGRTAEAQRRLKNPTGNANGPAAASASAIQDAYAEKTRQLYRTELNLAQQIRDAKISGQDHLLNGLHQELAVAREVAQLAQRLQTSETEAAAIIRQRVAAEQEITAIKRIQQGLDASGSGGMGGMNRARGGMGNRFQVGLAGANMAQDMLQSNGSALQSIGSGVNNVLGAATMGAKAGVAAAALFAVVAAVRLLSDKYTELTSKTLDAKEKQDIESEVQSRAGIIKASHERAVRTLSKAYEEAAARLQKHTEALQQDIAYSQYSLARTESIATARVNLAKAEAETIENSAVRKRRVTELDIAGQSAALQEQRAAADVEIEITNRKLATIQEVTAQRLIKLRQAKQMEQNWEGQQKVAALQGEVNALKENMVQLEALRKTQQDSLRKLKDQEIILSLDAKAARLKTEKDITDDYKEQLERRHQAQQSFLNKIADATNRVANKAKADAIAEAEKEATNAPKRQEYELETRILQLRASHHERQARALERERKIIEETQRLKAMGYADDEAARKAKERVDLTNPNARGAIHALTKEEQATNRLNRMSAADRQKLTTATDPILLGRTRFSGLDAYESRQASAPLAPMTDRNHRQPANPRTGPGNPPAAQSAPRDLNAAVVTAIQTTNNLLRQMVPTAALRRSN